MAIVFGLLGPIIIAFCVFCRKAYNDNFVTQSDSSTKSWKFSERSSSLSTRQTTPLKNVYEKRGISPSSDITTTSSSSKKKLKMRYDGVYRTHEPLPGKPDIDFEDKDWDLSYDDINSPTTSGSNTSTNVKKISGPSKVSSF